MDFLVGLQRILNVRRVQRAILFLCFAWPAISTLAFASDVQKSVPPRRILVIFFMHAGIPWQDEMAESLRTKLESDSPYPIELHIEYSDLVSYTDEAYRQKLVELYRYKYCYPQMDLIIGVGDEAADFLIANGEVLFGTMPMVIVSANPKTLQRDSLKPNMTSLVWEADVPSNIQLIEKLVPQTRHLYIISGSSRTDREAEKVVRKALQQYRGPFEINYIGNCSKEDLLARVARLPADSALFYTVVSLDATGAPVVSKSFVSAVSAKANAPVFGILDSYLGEGIVGGHLLSAEEQGRRCAEIAVRILTGESPADIYPARLLNHVMYDWRQLKRWGISEDRLPPESIVRFKTPTPWQLYRKYIIAGVLLLVFGYGFVSVLLVQRRRLRRSESELERELRFEEMLSALSVRFVNLPPDQVGPEIRRNLETIARQLEVDRVSVFEISADTQMLIAFHYYTNSDIAAPPSKVDWTGLTWGRQKIYNGEMVIFSHIDELPAEAGVEKDYFRSQGVQSAVVIPLVAGQLTLGVLTMAMLRHRREWRDSLIRRFKLVAAVFANAIARKRSDEALIESKQFKRSVLDSLKYLLAVADSEGNILDVNESWIQFARQNDAHGLDRIGVGSNYLEVCRRSAADGAELAQTVLDGIKSVLDGALELFELEYPCDSPVERRWFWMRVIPFSGPKGGVIITHIDISERKQAETALQHAYREIEHLKDQLEAERNYLQEEIKLEHNFDKFIGSSAAIQYVLFKVKQVAALDTSVLILGETGTGKELVARAIHSTSLREKRPLVKVNCAALPANLIESELFGHERGAFTGAQARAGRFEVAHGSTLFLDEIGELPLELQAKLLGVLQDGEFQRLGNSRTIKVDVRIIVATNRNLQEEVRKGQFREDLFYRLNVFPITVPPLRERLEDIPLLATFFTRNASKRLGKSIEQIPANVMKNLQEYHWPGNVRELENVIERAVIASSGPKLRLADELKPSPLALPALPKTMQEVEFDHILGVLKQTSWKVSGKGGAAEILGLKRNTLLARMKKLGIHKP
ncbi:sigma 54-interacting transcriptional regulator [Syntrophobacteraceae bacterium DRH4]|nr:ABC transporter substrate binding protein [Desulfoferrobacter suflitae]MCK8603435.1 sigma 54-interacting transcriptional regulator [Desulfoferrobacter suflitae]